MAEELEAEIINVLFENTKKISSLNDIFNYLDEVIDYLKKNEDMYRLLLTSNEPQVFLRKLNHSILDKMYNAINNNPNFKNSASLKFEIDFFTDGIVSAVLNYFTGRFEYSLDEICENTKKIFMVLFLK